MREFREVITLLEKAVQASLATNGNISVTLRYNPFATGGSQGNEPWQALLRLPDVVICQYGDTIEDAAERLLDSFLHPEKYPDQFED